jgi:transposase
MFRTLLQQKCQKAGRAFVVIDEKNTTRACSGCGALTGPTGLDMLVVRAWGCSECGAEHDRDTNAARNILARAKVLGWKPPPKPVRSRSGVRERERAPQQAWPAEPGIPAVARQGVAMLHGAA